MLHNVSILCYIVSRAYAHTRYILKKGREYMDSNIGSKLRTLRKGRKLSQEEAANRLNITRASISNYEVGRRSPHLSELKRIAEFYGVGLDYFGVTQTDEVFDLLSRAKIVFASEHVPKEKKEELFKEIMRIYTSL